jgi:hypothetical protein
MIEIERDIIKERYLTIIKNQWLNSKDSIPEFLPKISTDMKIQNENYITAISGDFHNVIKTYPRLPIGRKKWKKNMFQLLDNVLFNETVIGIHKSMDQKALGDFQNELIDFLRKEREFAPELSFLDIGQAIRNYIVYAMFKQIHGLQDGFSLPAFGYSMLYPFTDNYIDSSDITDKEKAEYNKLIHDKISGKIINPLSIHHKKTCELLQAIEDEYPRDKDSRIYSLLLMMLEAQEDSIRQQKKGIPLSLDERLDISLYKGGISVLIDRFLVNKELTENDLLFYLGFGFFLQLADDLQDIEEDSKQVNQTIFTLNTCNDQEEKLVNKMLHFIQQIIVTYTADNNKFKEFLLSNCYQLIFTSTVGSKKFFSLDYLKILEESFPISNTFLENWKRNQPWNKEITVQDKYMKMLDELIM